MLADDIALAAAQLLPGELWYNTWNTMARRVAAAERLVLRRDVVQTAQSLACSRPSSMRDTVDLAKPPYPATWVEWADCDKREVRAEFGMTNLSGSAHPTRVGALITQLGQDSDEYRVEYAWTHGGPDKVCVSVAAITLSLGEDRGPTTLPRAKILDAIKSRSDVAGTYWYLYRNKPNEIEAYADLMTRIGYHPADVATMDLGRMISDPRMEPLAKNLYDDNLGDIDGETIFLISVLLLLNTFNATRKAREDLSRLNKSRRKQKNPELLEYDTILMRLSKKERDEHSMRAGGTGGGGPKMSHICRGHYKRLNRPDGSTRLAWWRSHWRGSGPRTAAGRTREVSL